MRLFICPTWGKACLPLAWVAGVRTKAFYSFSPGTCQEGNRSSHCLPLPCPWAGRSEEGMTCGGVGSKGQGCRADMLSLPRHHHQAGVPSAGQGAGAAELTCVPFCGTIVEQVFRQKGGSSIIKAAHTVLAGTAALCLHPCLHAPSHVAPTLCCKITLHAWVAPPPPALATYLC